MLHTCVYILVGEYCLNAIINAICFRHLRGPLHFVAVRRTMLTEKSRRMEIRVGEELQSKFIILTVIVELYLMSDFFRRTSRRSRSKSKGRRSRSRSRDKRGDKRRSRDRKRSKSRERRRSRDRRSRSRDRRRSKSRDKRSRSRDKRSRSKDRRYVLTTCL